MYLRSVLSSVSLTRFASFARSFSHIHIIGRMHTEDANLLL